MTLSRTTRLVMIAMAAWIGIEIVLSCTGWGDLGAIDDSGPDGFQGAFILFHWIGLMLAQWWRLPVLSSWMVAEIVTFVQMFALFWVVIALWRSVYASKAG